MPLLLEQTAIKFVENFWKRNIRGFLVLAYKNESSETCFVTGYQKIQALQDIVKEKKCSWAFAFHTESLFLKFRDQYRGSYFMSLVPRTWEEGVHQLEVFSISVSVSPHEFLLVKITDHNESRVELEIGDCFRFMEAETRVCSLDRIYRKGVFEWRLILNDWAGRIETKSSVALAEEK